MILGMGPAGEPFHLARAGFVVMKRLPLGHSEQGRGAPV
jgi:hypothetical protein